MIIVNHKHNKVVIPLRADVEALIPSATRFRWKNKTWLAVPHKVTEVKLLNNLGIRAPTPIMHNYDWSSITPFDSQKKTAAMLVAEHRAFVLSALGTGKTCATLFAVDYLLKTGAAKKVLVVAPLSTLHAVWGREIFNRFNQLSYMVLHGNKAKRLNRLATGAQIDIINHDGVHVIQQELMSNSYDIVIVDELASYRNARTRRWKALKPVVLQADYAWGLTGAPTPNEPADAWAQCRLLTPKRVPFSARKFKDQTMRQISQFKWVPRDEATDIVHQAMQPSVRFTREDCFDLPPTTYSTRTVDLTGEQKQLYSKMVNEAALQIRSQEVTAANEGVAVSKLLQIASGFVYDNNGKPAVIKSAPRFRLLLEILEEVGDKAIVFTPFKFSVSMISAAVAPFYSIETITGDTPAGKRAEIFTRFQDAAKPEILIAHPACMSHGVNLQRSNTIIWFAPLWNAEIYNQANGRITRAGQTRKTHIIHLESTPIEKRVYNRLRKKQKLSGVLLDMFSDQTEKL